MNDPIYPPPISFPCRTHGNRLPCNACVREFKQMVEQSLNNNATSNTHD